MELAGEVRGGMRVYCEMSACTLARRRNFSVGGLVELQPNATTLEDNTCENCTAWQCSRANVLEARFHGPYRIWHPCK